MAGGFYKVRHELHRLLIRDADAFRVCLELRHRARYTDGPYLGSHGIVDLEAGQCVIGRAELATALGLTEATIRTCLNRLARLGEITVESTKLGSVVTLCDRDGNAERSPTNQPSTDGQINQAPQSESTNGPTTSEDLKKKDPKKKDRKRQLPSDWKPRDHERALAAELALDFEGELRKFRDYHTAKGSVFADWDAGLRTWLRNAVEFAPRSRRAPIAFGGAQPATNFDTAMRLPAMARANGSDR